MTHEELYSNKTSNMKRYPDNHRNISLFTVSSRHPLNVKPSGNLLYNNGDSQLTTLSKEEQMGYLSIFPDELVLHLLSYISDVDTLKALSHTSRIMYAFLYDEEVWKKLYVRNSLENERIGKVNSIQWRGSWRATIINVDDEEQANLQIPDNVLCSDALYRPFQCSQINYQKLFSKILKEEERYHLDSINGELGCLPNGRIQRFQEDALSLEQFNKYWSSKPFILTNPNSERWPKWDLNTLLNRFPDVKFRQEAVKWNLSLYAQYLERNKDENPLYLFDCSSEAMAQLKKEYTLPEIFQHDLFSVFQRENIQCRPDYAWLIVGSARSCSTFHKDPNHTSAWNAALTGRKLWIMLPPTITPPGVGTDSEESEVTSPVGIAEWVMSGFFNDCLKIEECLIGVTFPNECMYVPSGWWHSVINIDDSVALTQNFVPLPNLTNVLNFFKNKRDQISGFRPNQVNSALKEILKTNLEYDVRNKLEEYSKKFDELNLNQHLQDEDCGEILPSLLPPMPVFELYTQLLRDNGKEQELINALLKLEKLEAAENNFARRSETWEKLTTTESGGHSFSFGFDLNESDEE